MLHGVQQNWGDALWAMRFGQAHTREVSGQLAVAKDLLGLQGASAKADCS